MLKPEQLKEELINWTKRCMSYNKYLLIYIMKNHLKTCKIFKKNSHFNIEDDLIPFYKGWSVCLKVRNNVW